LKEYLPMKWAKMYFSWLVVHAYKKVTANTTVALAVTKCIEMWGSYFVEALRLMSSALPAYSSMKNSRHDGFSR